MIYIGMSGASHMVSKKAVLPKHSFPLLVECRQRSLSPNFSVLNLKFCLIVEATAGAIEAEG